MEGMKRFYVLLAIFLFAACTTMQGARKNYVRNHSELTPEQKNAILNGDVIAGMTEDMVQVSWGTPIDIVNEVVNGNNVTTWIYQLETDSFINTYRVRFIEGEVSEVRLVNARERRYYPYYHQHNESNKNPSE